jgi:hypothetical protein
VGNAIQKKHKLSPMDTVLSNTARCLKALDRRSTSTLIVLSAVSFRVGINVPSAHVCKEASILGKSTAQAFNPSLDSYSKNKKENRPSYAILQEALLFVELSRELAPGNL